MLDQTLVVVAADHGEGLGEHGLFDHGESLYRTELRVPLVIVLPGGRGRSSTVVDEFVSLCDIPATIADIVRPGTKSPFPGRRLTRFTREASSRPAAPTDELAVISELRSPNPTDPNQGRSPAYRGPLISLAVGDFVYIRNEGDGSEELFNQRDDPYELINRARDDAMLPVLRRFRDRLQQANAHPQAVTSPGRPRGIALERREQTGQAPLLEQANRSVELFPSSLSTTALTSSYRGDPISTGRVLGEQRSVNRSGKPLIGY